MNKIPVSINGINIYPFKDINQLIEYALEEKKILIAINAEKLLNASNETREIINRNIGYPDGIGAVWALKQKGEKAIRIPGVELWLKIIEKYHSTRSIYLIGGKDKVIISTVKKLKKEYPGIKIVNYRDGYIKSKDEQLVLINDIKKKKPDIVFVAMGSPRQEILMKEMHNAHPAIYQGLGGSFDVYTGIVKRAPKLFANNGMEWFYRWLKQPRSRSVRIFKLSIFYWKLKTNQF